MTIVSCWIDTNFPRTDAGETSAMYIGERLEARPIPNPPSQRKPLNAMKSQANAVPIAEDGEQQARQNQQPLATQRSLSVPAMAAPNRQPSSALLIARP